MINSCKIIREIFFSKNHCEIQVRTILVCALYSIKYGRLFINTSVKCHSPAYSGTHLLA